MLPHKAPFATQQGALVSPEGVPSQLPRKAPGKWDQPYFKGKPPAQDSARGIETRREERLHSECPALCLVPYGH